MNFPRPGERGARDCVLAITSRGRIPWKLARIARLRHNLSSPFPPLFSCSSFSKLIRCYWSVPNRSISNKTCALLTRAQRKKEKEGETCCDPKEKKSACKSNLAILNIYHCIVDPCLSIALLFQFYCSCLKKKYYRTWREKSVFHHPLTSPPLG